MIRGRSVLAFIPARSGSKRLPGKNIKELCGKPMIAYTIEAAKGCDYVDEVLVSSDSADVLAVASKHGARPLLRPPELAGDDACPLDALKHALEYTHADIIMYLQPTSPLRTSEHINDAIDLFLSCTANSVISVNEQREHNGAIYILKKSNIDELIDCNQSIEYMMFDEHSVDVDTIGDFKLAERALNETL